MGGALFKKAVFDVMQNDRFAATLRMPVTHYVDGAPVVTESMMRKYAAEKMPTLKYQKFTVHYSRMSSL